MISDKDLVLMESMMQHGSAITVTTTTGTDCPCRLEIDANNAQYSSQYHDDHPLIDDCNGTLLIDTTSTTKTIYGVVVHDFDTIVSYLKPSNKEPIGLKNNRAMLIAGAYDPATGTYFQFDLTDIQKKRITFTVNSIVYRLYDFVDTRSHQFGVMSRVD